MHHLGRRTLPALFALTVAVAACGSDDDDAGPEAPVGSAVGTPTASGAPGEAPETPDSDAPGETPDGDATTPDSDETESGVNPRNSTPGPPPALDGEVPDGCPQQVLTTGDTIAGDFEHVERGPVEGLNVLTCEWRASGHGIASIEVSFAAELVGTDLSSLPGATPVTVAGVDGHYLHVDEGHVNMFQFVAGDLFVTGGSIDVPDLRRADVLKLAAAAIRAVGS